MSFRSGLFCKWSYGAAFLSVMKNYKINNDQILEEDQFVTRGKK